MYLAVFIGPSTVVRISHPGRASSAAARVKFRVRVRVRARVRVRVSSAEVSGVESKVARGRLDSGSGGLGREGGGGGALRKLKRLDQM